MSLKYFSQTTSVLAVALFASTSVMAQAANTQSNNQQNRANVLSEVNATINSVTEGVTAAAVAIGNSFSAELTGTTDLNSFQRNSSPT